jgi:hypothetical protein
MMGAVPKRGKASQFLLLALSYLGGCSDDPSQCEGYCSRLESDCGTVFDEAAEDECQMKCCSNQAAFREEYVAWLYGCVAPGFCDGTADQCVVPEIEPTSAGRVFSDSCSSHVATCDADAEIEQRDHDMGLCQVVGLYARDELISAVQPCVDSPTCGDLESCMDDAADAFVAPACE